MRRNFERRILRNVTCCLLLAVFDKEGAEATKEDVLLTNLGRTDLLHKFFDNRRYGYGLDTRCTGDLIHDFDFCHIVCSTLYICDKGRNFIV